MILDICMLLRLKKFDKIFVAFNFLYEPMMRCFKPYKLCPDKFNLFTAIGSANGQAVLTIQNAPGSRPGCVLNTGFLAAN